MWEHAPASCSNQVTRVWRGYKRRVEQGQLWGRGVSGEEREEGVALTNS